MAAGPSGLELEVVAERWPVAGAFTIARGSRSEAEVVVATIRGDGGRGRGECMPYARYGESVDGVMATIRSMADALASGCWQGGIGRSKLASLMPAGAARNALDCALWDLEAKRSGRRACTLAGLRAAGTVLTAYTISLKAPDEMAAAARKAAARYRLLKLKLGGDGDEARLAAVRQAAPNARLIVDANEGWRPADLARRLAACAAAGVELVEQPLPAADDAALAETAHPIPVCADESVHTSADLARLRERYDAVNIKLDKAGGLTEALAMAEAAHAMGYRIMVGCMLATSLAMAPALLLADRADWVDLDGPLLLARDRMPGLIYRNASILPPPPELWG